MNRSNGTSRGASRPQTKKKQDKKPYIPEPSPNPSMGQAAYDYAHRIVDPEGQDAHLAPAPITTRGTPIKSKMVIDLKEHYADSGSGSGTCYGWIRPDPHGMLTLTTVNSDSTDTEPLNWHFAAAYGVSGDLLSMRQANVRHGAYNAAGQITQGKYAVEIFAFHGESADFDCTLDHDAPGVVKTAQFYRVGEDTPLFTQKVTGGIPATVTAQYGRDDEGFYYFKATSGNGEWTASFVPSSSSTLKQKLPYTETSSTTIGSPVLDDVPGLEYYRLTALGMLLTYEGSELNNGGRVACGRVSKYWALDEADPINSIAKLPNDNHEGPLKKGFHMHWTPATIEDLIPRGAGDRDLNPMFRYVFAIAADDKSQSTRLKLTMHMEYYSSSPAYGAMNYAPDAEGLSIALRYLALTVPVCTENDTHLVKKALKKIGAVGMTGLKYVLANPQVLAKLVALL